MTNKTAQFFNVFFSLIILSNIKIDYHSLMLVTDKTHNFQDFQESRLVRLDQCGL